MVTKRNPMFLAFTVTAIILLFVSNMFVCGVEWEPTWSARAAEEAEAVATIPCSGHGRAFLDGLVLNGLEPVCECNSCYAGSDCSKFLSNCSANAQGGDPLFLEPFWMQHAASSAMLVSGWHRMSYTYSDGSYISEMLVKHIRKLHDMVGNAVTEGRYIIIGVGATQLLNAAVYALSLNSSMSPAKVVTTAPSFQMYKTQTELFSSRNYIYKGDTSLWKNNSDNTTRFIEFVTSPNNPDGKLNKAVLHGPNVKTIHDHTYYWPHFTAIPSPADEDLMVFSLTKLTGHAGCRLGWGIIKDEEVYKRMLRYVFYNTMGVCRESQLRALKLIEMIHEREGKEIFEFSYAVLRSRWIKLKQIISKSSRFSIQKLSPQYCNYFKRVRDPSPAYVWLKCTRTKDKNCYEILEAGGIIGRAGSMYGADNLYMRLSLIRSEDDFEILINKLQELVAKEKEIETKIKLSDNVRISAHR